MFASLAPICLLTCLASSAGATLLDTRSSYGGNCFSGVYLLYARGTNERFGSSAVQGTVDDMMRGIPNSTAVEVVYPANVSLTPSIPIGVDFTQSYMTAYYDKCPNSSIVLMGYSQGAMVIGNSLAGNNNTTPYASPIAENIGRNVAAVVLYGDPNRVEGQGITADTINSQPPCNTTSSGPRLGPYYTAMEVYANRTAEWCAAGDPICCHTGKNLDDHNSYFTRSDSIAVVNFVRTQIGLNATYSAAPGAKSQDARHAVTMALSICTGFVLFAIFS